MFAMSLIGGIFGILASIIVMALGKVADFIGFDSSVTLLGFLALLFSVLGIVAGTMAKTRTKLAGWLLLVAGIGGFVCISMYFIVTGILYIIAGLMGVFAKTAKASDSQQAVS